MRPRCFSLSAKLVALEPRTTTVGCIALCVTHLGHYCLCLGLLDKGYSAVKKAKANMWSDVHDTLI